MRNFIITAAGAVMLAIFAVATATDASARAKAAGKPNPTAVIAKCKAEHGKVWTFDGKVDAMGRCWRDNGFRGGAV